MTVSVGTPREVLTYTGPGDYDFGFPVQEAAFLEITHRGEDGSITTLTISVDYTVSLNGDTTGTATVTFDTGAPYEGDLIFTRNVPIEQPVDWVNGGFLDVELLEASFDRQILIIQELKNLIDVGTSAFNWRGSWTTTTFYTTNDIVKESKNLYICAEEHTSGTFATDLSAGKWELLIAIADVADDVGILDEDNFVSNSPTKAPSQQSTAAYILSRVLDEDDMSSDDATKVPSQQSTKAYVDASGTTVEPAKTADYTLAGGSEVVPIDISSGSIDIDELALGSMDGIVDLVIVADAGDTSANNAELRDSSNTLVRVIGYQAGDRLRVAYDATTRRVLFGDGIICPRARAAVAKTADQNVGAGATENLLDANTSEEEDNGGHFASGAYTAPFAGRCRIVMRFLTEVIDNVQITYSIGGVTQIDNAGGVAEGLMMVLEFNVSSGDSIKPQVYNKAGAGRDVYGDAAKDETAVTFEMIERHG